VLKVMTILGTRPEIIRLSRTIPKMDATFRHVLVHTGQNYDPALNEVFFRDFGLRAPDHFLGVAGRSLGASLGAIMTESERVLLAERPDAVLILGDTNSAMSAIVARRMKIPVYHVEAGNRSFDRNVPEETNRKVVDHVSDFNLVYTEHARRNLLAEGFPARRIYLVGSPLREVLDFFSERIDGSRIIERLGLEPGRYLLVSLHREENVDHRERFSVLLETLGYLQRAHGVPVIVSTHPRTRNRMEKMPVGSGSDEVRFLPPFAFFDYIQLQRNALCTVSDSGTVSEEAGILSFPAVTPRDSIERPEGLDAACVVATGVNADSIVEGVDFAIRLNAARTRGGSSVTMPVEYRIADTSDRILGLITSTARVSNSWDNIRTNDLSL